MSLIYHTSLFIITYKGAFNNYVDRILPFFDPSPWTVFIPRAWTKTDILWPPPPHLVHVVIECPPKCLFFFNFKSNKKEVQASVHVNLFSPSTTRAGYEWNLKSRTFSFFPSHRCMTVKWYSNIHLSTNHSTALQYSGELSWLCFDWFKD